MDEIDEFPTQNIRLYPCEICQRKFQQETLVKHRNICKKTAQKGRKIFDSGKQRSEGSDVIYQKTKDTKKVQVLGQKPEVAPPNSNWREKHDQFIKNVRNARVVTEAIKTGAPVPKFEASAVPSDYVNCGFCGRNFSSAAAERHIPFCEQQKKRQKINNSANQKPKVNYSKKYSSDGQYGQSGSESAPHNAPRGHNPNLQGYASGNDRKPIKYDSNLYYDSDVPDNGSGYGGGYGGGYGVKNNSAKQQYSAKSKQDQLLRTGRNQSNNDLNTLARNRGQKDSPLQSRDPSKSRYGNQPSPSGPNKNTNYGRQASQQQNSAQNEGLGATSKFCHECGSEFPVKWARFCSFCGDRRL